MKDSEKKSSDIIQLVSFSIGNEEFGVDILKVREINRMTEITKMPNAPEFIEGVINLRGRIIPVISLRKRLGLKRIVNNRDTRIIVVELNGKILGFIVDSVSEVLRIPRSITELPPSITVNVDSDYITSIARLEDQLLIQLDLEKILLSEEIQVLENIEN